MKKLVVGALGAIVMLGVASPARADWQFTNWGMSKEELKQASAVEIRDTDKVCNNLVNEAREIGKKAEYLASDWQVGKIKFTNCYLFGENNSLAGVVLNLDNYRSTKLVYHLLVDKYGYTTVDKSIESLDVFWYEWHTNENIITFLAEKVAGKVKTSVFYQGVKPSLEEKVSEEKMIWDMEKIVSDTRNVCTILDLSFDNPPSSLCQTYLNVAPKYLESAKASSNFDDRLLHYKAFMTLSDELSASLEPYFEKLAEKTKS